SSRFFGAGLSEIAAAAGAGFIAGSLALAIPRDPRAARLFELTAAFSVTVWVAVLQAAGVAVAPFVVILAGLIVLVPGLTLTVAVSELATKNLVSGSARLTFAGMSLLQIALGVAFGQQVGLHLFGPLVDHTPTALAPLTEVAALIATSLAISALFQAPLWLMPIIVAVTAVAILGARVGGWLLTPPLGASIGALFVAMLGNLYSRWTDRPAVVLIVPGMMLLVPGSLGFRSINSLMQQDLSMGLETAFNMGLIAVAIVAGLLVANVVLPPRIRR
ncbi:MAG: threonine/serine exporter family protein, partial [Myxococcota bacterium]